LGGRGAVLRLRADGAHGDPGVDGRGAEPAVRL